MKITIFGSESDCLQMGAFDNQWSEDGLIVLRLSRGVEDIGKILISIDELYAAVVGLRREKNLMKNDLPKEK